MPDAGTIEWAKRVRVGYLDQHAVLEKGMTIGDVLRSAFAFLFEMEESMNQMYDQMAEADDALMEKRADFEERMAILARITTDGVLRAEGPGIVSGLDADVDFEGTYTGRNDVRQI